MAEIKELLEQFKYYAENPRKQLDKYLAEGKKAVRIFPYTILPTRVRLRDFFSSVMSLPYLAAAFFSVRIVFARAIARRVIRN